jgi:hypothetical protein
MIRSKTPLNFVICFTAFVGLVFVIGCGSSVEKQTMTDFVQMYSDTVNEYAEADESKRATMKEKMDSFNSTWSDMKMDLGSLVTPNVLEELDKQYKEIAKKYGSLIGKS